MKRAIIVIPTYNESSNIHTLVEKIFQIAENCKNWTIEILVVDSGSPDGTSNTVKNLQKKYSRLHLLETKKEGLGKAYSSGFTYALEKLKPYVLFEMDADLSHNPSDIPQFLYAIEKGADFVVGSRYIKGGSIPKDWGVHRKIFSVIGNLIVRFGFMRLGISEWTNGYRAIKAWIVKEALPHLSQYSGYVFQVAFLDFAYTKKAHIREVPVHFSDRLEGVSKINSVQYIFQTLYYVFTHSPFIKFVIVGLVGFGVDFGFASLFINRAHFQKPFSNALSAEIAIAFNFILNNFWSFKHSKIQGGLFSYIKKFVLFILVSSGSIIIQWVGLTLSLSLFGDRIFSFWGVFLESWVVYKVLIIAFVIIPYSYILYNKIIWKK